jgi:uncharacterized integral membrane protein
MLVDTPAPGAGYVLLYVGLIVFLVALPIFLKRFRKIRGWTAIGAFVICFAAAGAFLVFLQAGYATRYTMDNVTLTLRSGLFLREQVKINDIKEMRIVPTNWQALGWALTRMGYCNRFNNALKLVTARGLLYLSPTNPDQFIEEIKSRQRTSSILRRNLIFR